MRIYEVAQTGTYRLRFMIGDLWFGRGADIVKAVIISGLCAGAIILMDALILEYNTLKTDLATARRELATSKQRTSRLEIWAAGMVSDQAQSHGGQPGGQGNSGPRNTGYDAPLDLGRDELQLLRRYIKIPPAPTGASATVVVGGAVDDQRLMPLPSQISDKVPELIGARFTTDRNGAIIIVRRGSSRINAVVSP